MRTFALRGNMLMVDNEPVLYLGEFRTPEGKWVYDWMREQRAWREFIVAACNAAEKTLPLAQSGVSDA